MRIMTLHRVRYLPVFETGKLVGVVSIGDVVKALLDRQSATVESLTAYIGQG
jgi:CBS domain-containing protein